MKRRLTGGVRLTGVIRPQGVDGRAFVSLLLSQSESPMPERGRSGLMSGLCQEDAKASCCTKDEGRSLGAASWEEASNSHKLLRSRAAVGNVMVKRRDFDHVMYGLERRLAPG